MDDRWDDEDRYYHYERDSDDSPLLANRHENHRRHEMYASTRLEDRPRRSTLSVLTKLFLFCSAMILFCVLMYIPVYYKASDQVPKGVVEGWSIQSNRDTKIYVQPNNLTTRHQPKQICDKTKNKLFLLIVVCSSTTNFKQRIAIRQTWGNYKKYLTTSEIYQSVKQKYINYNFTYDLYPGIVNVSKVKRNLSSFKQMLPVLAEALKHNLGNVNTAEAPEKRFDDEMLPEFDMNEEIGEETEPTYDYYESNIMKIAPNGYEESPDINKVLKMLRQNKNLKKLSEAIRDDSTGPDFKLVFLLGLPANDNDSTIQGKIEAEVEKYGDVIQEGFIDSYNNLTLKSILMLKWITNNCGDRVRYILKTDDDMYVNVPNLIASLRNRSQQFDARPSWTRDKEYLLIGDLICGAKPVLDSHDKWFSPRYMYPGRVYPKYLSGTGYALSLDTASALYEAALRTDYFHLEDIFITGMCAERAQPRILPRDDPLFSYQPARGVKLVCAVHSHATAHRISPGVMFRLNKQLNTRVTQDECERIRLTKVRQDRLKPKLPPKKSKLSKLFGRT